MDYAVDSTKLIKKIEKVMSGGWFIFNLTKRTIYCSDFVVEHLKLPRRCLKSELLSALIHPDDRERITMGLDMLVKYEKVKTLLRICEYNDPENYHYVRIQMGELCEEEDGTVVYGFVQHMENDKEVPFNWEVLNTQHKELKYWQNSMPRFLQMLLEYKKFGEVSTEILNSILKRFNADRVYLVEYDWSRNTRSCIYETSREGVGLEKDRLQNIPTSPDKWWHSELLAGNLVVVDDVHDAQEGELKSILLELGITSIMLVPLIERGKTWGYIGVDVVNRARLWRENEQRWFQAIGHIASVGLALRRAYSDTLKEKKYLERLQENMPAGMEVYDREGFLVEANQKAVDMFGLVDRHNLRRLNLNIFDDRFIPLEKLEALGRGESISCEFCYADSKPKHIILDATPLCDEKGVLTNYLVILSDHTEMMETYARLDEFKKMFTLISEFSEVGFFRINLMDPRLSYEVTDQWFHNFNAEQPQVKLASSLIPDTIDPAEAAEIGAFLEQTIQGGAAEYHKQVKVLNTDGSYRWLRVHIKVVDYRPQENQVTVFGLSVDVTQLKAVEHKLIEAKTKAEESDRLKSAFLANMSHEIRTPLNAIVGFSNMIVDDPTSELNRDFASLVIKNNELLLQIISDVLDLAKIEAGIFEAVLTSTNLNGTCQEVLDSFASQRGEGIELLFVPQQSRLEVLCDRNRVVQVLNNFMSNALKFTQEGRIELGFEIKRNGFEQFVEFYVSDTGKGMSPVEAENCFERFAKADSFVQGAGLGLSVCKELIAKLNGTIGVDSVQGVGSRFWFRLPYMPVSDDLELADGLTALTADGRKPVILIAEDTVVNFLIISSMLRQYYTVIVVQNGQDAVRVHAERSPDLILMDLKMPRMDGLEATRTIRQSDTKTPIVAITAFAFEYDKKAAIDAGCNYILTKPINNTQLRKIVKHFIETGHYEKSDVNSVL